MRPSITEFLESHGLHIVAMLFPTKGIIYAIAMVAVVWLFLRRCRQVGLPFDEALSAAAVSGVAGLIGARIYHLLGTGTAIGPDPLVLLARNEAGSWGGYLGGLIGMWAYLRFMRSSTLRYLDIAPAAAMLAPAIGRWGCLLAGCDFGRVTSVPWAISYPQGSPAYHAQVAAAGLPLDATQSLGVHPLPIYLSLNAIFLFFVMTAIWRRTRHRPGTTIAISWALYGSTRFFWEFFRDPAAGGASSGLSLPQWMAIAAVCVGAAIGAIASRRWRQPTARPCVADA